MFLPVVALPGRGVNRLLRVSVSSRLDFHGFLALGYGEHRTVDIAVACSKDARSVMSLNTGFLLFIATAALNVIFATGTVLELPNTSGIDGQLTANLGVDHFFSLWLVFNNDDVKMSGKFSVMFFLHK